MVKTFPRIKNKKILIAGCAGFLGRIACNYFIERNNTIIGVDDMSTGGIVGNCTKFYNSTIENFVQTQKLNYDYFLNFAGISSEVKAKLNPVKSTVSMVQIALVHQYFKDTVCFYPSTGSLLNHNFNTYSLIKFEIEKILEKFGNTKVARIFAVYGPNEYHKGNYASMPYQLCNAFKKDLEFDIWGDGNQTREYIYEDDFLFNLERFLISDNINCEITSSEQVSHNEIIKMLEELTKNKIEINYKNKPSNYLKETKSEDLRYNACEINLYQGLKNIYEIPENETR